MSHADVMAAKCQMYPTAPAQHSVMFHSAVVGHSVVSGTAELGIPLLETLLHRTPGRPRQSIRLEGPGTAQGCVENKETLSFSGMPISSAQERYLPLNPCSTHYSFNQSSPAHCFLLLLSDRRPGTGTLILKDS